MKKLKIFENKSKEYVIWGCDKNHTTEILLLSSIEGRNITDKIEAENWERILKEKFGCYNTRIQTIDLLDNNIKIFESDNLADIFQTNEYKQLSSLKRNIIYCYVMLESKNMTIQQLANKFDISYNLVKAWAKYGKDYYSEIKNN